MHDEQASRGHRVPPRFFTYPDEPYTSDGRAKIRRRILGLFDDVKRDYSSLFTARDEIALSDRALAFLVSELAPYDLSATDIDAKGIAYQELVGTNLRGDRGQYFTPRGAVKLMVEILDPQEHETVLDPACGTGGFLRETLAHLLHRWQEDDGTTGLPDTDEQLDAHQRRLRAYAEKHLFGADFDPFLVRATSANIMVLTAGERDGNIFHMDSLAFPRGHLDDVARARVRIPLDLPETPSKVDVLMANPPFGSDIKIIDPEILAHYEENHGVARTWSRDRATGKRVATVRDTPPPMAPEQLFIQRAVEWVRPGGRIGIVLPNGILSNPGPADEAIRQWILDRCWVLASVELPVETFIVDANVNILTTLLFLKKTEQERLGEGIDQIGGTSQDYPVFMAVAEKVGVDRRGNDVYVRQPDGEIVFTMKEEKERIRIGGREQIRVLRRREKLVDNDLPRIAEAYRKFRASYPEPGLPR
ncbi:HsdM family class I SAM-dependent methyltransferase [Protofrankia symbiont of Coriaria ruscifolia]|nr:N-6 DNA methylase [Protofrankia symbiont of Coriaria ruscifolia]